MSSQGIIAQLLRAFARLTDWSASLALFVLLVVFNVAVFMRYFMHSPLFWTEEVAGLLMIWIVMVGGIAAERDDTHLAIPLFTDLLPRKPRAIFNLVIAILSAIFLVYVAWVGWELAQSVTFRVTSILRISLIWVYLAVPVGLVISAIYLVGRNVRLTNAALSAHDSTETDA